MKMALNQYEALMSESADKMAELQNRASQDAETIKALREALERINRRASPDGPRTFDDTISALDWITAEARAALAGSAS